MKSIIFFITIFICYLGLEAKNRRLDQSETGLPQIAIADSLREIGKLTEAIKILIELADGLSIDQNAQLLGNIGLQIADIQIEQGEFDLAKSSLDSLLIQFKSTPAITTIQFSRTYRSLASVVARQKADHIQAWDFNQKSLSYLEGDFPGLLAEKSKVYYGLGQSLFFQRRALDSAIHFFEKALLMDSLSKKSDLFFRASVYREMGTTMLVQQNFRQSKAYLNMSLREISNSEAKNRTEQSIKYQIYSNLSSWAMRANKIDSAINWGYASLDILHDMKNPSEFLLGQAYSNMSGKLYMKGDFQKANKMADLALQIRLRTLGPNHPRLAFTYIQKGNVLSVGLGQNEKAREFIDAAYRINVQTYGKNYGGNLNILINLTFVYNRLGLWEESLVFAKQGLDISLELYKTENQQVALFHSIMGDIYDNMNRPEESLDSYKKAEQILLKWEGPSSIPIADFSYSIAEFYFKNGDPVSSSNYLNKAKSIYESNNYHRTVNYNQVLGSLARNQMHLGNLEEATKFIDMTFVSNLRTDQSTFDVTKLSLNEVLSEITLIENTLLLAKLEQMKYEAKQEIRHLENALELFRLTQEHTWELLKSGTSDADVLNLMEVTRSVAPSGTNIAESLYALTDEKKYLEAVFQFMESSRGRLLKRTSLKRQALVVSNIPEALTNLDRQLGVDISFFKSKLVQDIDHLDSDDKNRLALKVFSLQQRRDSILNIIKQRYGEFYELKYGQPSFTLEEVQDKLSPHQTIIMYQMTDDTLYTLVINKFNSEVHKITLPENHDQLLDDFPNQLIDQKNDAFEQTALKLGASLIAPVENEIQRKSLVIIPDGKLWNLNFDLLKTTNNNYLIQDHPISYAVSVNLLLNGKKSERPKKQMLAFSFDDEFEVVTNIETVRKNRSVNLPGTVREIQGISSLIDGDYLFGNQASEKNFKENASDYNIIHLALHGEVDDQNTDNSKLFFVKSEVDSVEDGYLHPFELYNMQLKASLAILSGCNTGSGKISSGEGIMSLGRAFQYAGVNGLLLSQWEVSDAVAPRIMQEFYKNLKNGMPKDEALRQSKLTFLEKANNLESNPYYWGSFFILGDTAPINFEKRIPTGLLIALTVAFLLVIAYLIWSRRKSIS